MALTRIKGASLSAAPSERIKTTWRDCGQITFPLPLVSHPQQTRKGKRLSSAGPGSDLSSAPASRSADPHKSPPGRVEGKSGCRSPRKRSALCRDPKAVPFVIPSGDSRLPA
jgi:hypothetical protein